MEGPTYSSQVFGGDKSLLQGELDDYFETKPNFNFNEAESLGISYQDTFGLGG